MIVGLLGAVPVAFAKNPNPGVIPPQAKAHGMTYGEWSAKWWQWAVSLPLDHNPLADTADCSTGQLGSVWFLGGSFVSSTEERDCTVPPGKALFFPIINVECSTLEAPRSTVTMKRSSAAASQSSISETCPPKLTEWRFKT